MDMASVNMNLLIPVLQRWQAMFVIFFCMTSQMVSAQQAEINCELALDQGTYSQYLISVDEARVKRTQSELNQLVAASLLAASEVPVDGVLGVQTRAVLYQYCQGLATLPTGNFVISLTAKLDQQIALMAAVENTINDETPDVAPILDVKETPVIQQQVTKVNVVNTAHEQPAVVVADKPSIWYQLDEARLATVLEENAAQEPANLDDDSNTDERSDKKESVLLPDEEALKKFADLFGVAYLDEKHFSHAVLEKTGVSAAKYPLFVAELTSAAKNVSASTLNDIVLADDDCGCTREFSDTVYGFYPYWLSAEDKEVKEGGDIVEDEPAEEAAVALPSIDYSVINRIAYSALTVDGDGDIQKPLHWNSDGRLGNFINKAHRHKTKVDLVIYSDQWMNWSDSDQAAAVTSIYHQLKLNVTYKRSGLMGYVPFLNSTTASADGVTLYFENYADKPAAREIITKFVVQLYERLARDTAQLKINILLNIDSTSLEGSDDLFVDLKDLLVMKNSNTPLYVDSLILFLNEPTTDTKKLLRSKIEDEFSGEDRMVVLRKVIPVITPHGHENDINGPYTQFKDDLIYFNNNFAGIGLWPVPLKSDEDSEVISDYIIQQFSVKDVDGLLNSITAQYPALCDFACPNRSLLRIVFDVMLVFILGYGILALFSRRLRRFYSRNSGYFKLYIFATTAVFMASLMCDPFWKQKRDYVFVGSLLAVAAMYMIHKYSSAKQGPLP
jgi:hypothetical protein